MFSKSWNKKASDLSFESLGARGLLLLLLLLSFKSFAAFVVLFCIVGTYGVPLWVEALSYRSRPLGGGMVELFLLSRRSGFLISWLSFGLRVCFR